VKAVESCSIYVPKLRRDVTVMRGTVLDTTDPIVEARPELFVASDASERAMRAQHDSVYGGRSWDHSESSPLRNDPGLRPFRA
jgi:hypothetical protein